MALCVRLGGAVALAVVGIGCFGSRGIRHTGQIVDRIISIQGLVSLPVGNCRLEAVAVVIGCLLISQGIRLRYQLPGFGVLVGVAVP